MMIIEAQREYYCSSCKHGNGEELKADFLILDSARNDESSDGTDVDCEPIQAPPSPQSVTSKPAPPDIHTPLVPESLQRDPEIPTSSVLSKTKAHTTTATSTTTVTIPSSKDSGTADPPSVPKINKQRRSKKSSDQADAADQLRLAQTLIGNLERQILDLKNSNNLLKSELQLLQTPNEDIRPGRDRTSVPKSENGRPASISDGGADDLSQVRDRLYSLEHEMIRLRLQSVETSISMYHRMAPSMGNSSQFMQPTQFSPIHGTAYPMQYPPIFQTYHSHIPYNIQQPQWVGPHPQPYVIPPVIPSQPLTIARFVHPHPANGTTEPHLTYLQGQPLISHQRQAGRHGVISQLTNNNPHTTSSSTVAADPRSGANRSLTERYTRTSEVGHQTWKHGPFEPDSTPAPNLSNLDPQGSGSGRK